MEDAMFYNQSVLNSSTNGTDNMPSGIATVSGAIVMLFFFIVGLVGSLWILLAIALKPKARNITNVFIASLCINDIMTLCLVVALIIDSYVQRRWTAGEVMCKLNPEFTVAFTGSSLWHTALIAIHRYIVVVHNDMYKRMHKKAYVIFVLVSARAVPLACAIPGISLESSGYVPKLLRCILLPTEKVRIVAVTMIQIILPCTIVVLCYAFIFCFVLRITRRVQGDNLVFKREVQITRMFGVIFLNILLGFVPYAVVRNADAGNIFSADTYVVVTVFYGIAACSGPLVYGAMSRGIRKICYITLRDFLNLLPCCKHVRFSTGGRTELELARMKKTNTNGCHRKFSEIATQTMVVTVQGSGSGSGKSSCSGSSKSSPAGSIKLVNNSNVSQV